MTRVHPTYQNGHRDGNEVHRDLHNTPRTIPILLYHSISEHASPRFAPWAVRPALFESHLRHLRENGYTPVTVSQLTHLTAEARLPERPVVLTFDDGFADFYTDALPLLERYACPATLYITTDYVGQTSRWLAAEGEGNRPLLGWPQIGELAERGVECGAHTRTHPQLDTLSLEAAKAEIAGSKRALEARLGASVSSFAYPHGYHSPALKALVQDLGFTSACAVKHALSASHDDPFALARLIVFADTDLKTFRSLLRGDDLRVAPHGETWRTKGWRALRRAARVLKRPSPTTLRQPISDGDTPS